MSNVRTRFAPSPTGFMHIGGMRTALFNWLWARHNHGSFVLRIDDTDKDRNIDAALAPILEAFRWLGLDWDEGPEVGGPHGPYFQSERGDIYREEVGKLLSSGKAYRCFDPTEVTQADRKSAEQEKRNYLNIRRSLELTDDQVRRFLEEDRPHVVRLLVPRDQSVAIDDIVRGHVEWNCGLVSDPVIQRSDGSPLYNLATVVDDAAMQISHVIRAEEHLTNTAVQVLIYQALGYEIPTFAHIPFVAAPGSKEKLSKREKKIEKYKKNPQFKKMFEAADRVFPQLGLGSSETLNPVMVEYYERIGYLPQGVLNALSRLGWSLDDKTEFLSLDTVIENFSLSRIVKGSAGLDPEKLNSYEAHWMGKLSVDEKVAGCLPFLTAAGLISDMPHESTRERVQQIVTAVGDRLRIFSDVLDYSEFFVGDDAFDYDAKALKQRIGKPGAAELLADFRKTLAGSDAFDADSLERLMHGFVESRGIKIGDVIHAVRVAVTGKAKGFGMFESLDLLGKDSSLARIDRALGLCRGE